MMITIIDCGTGNVKSVANMLRKVGAESQVSKDPEAILEAEKLILPGVGSFDEGMTALISSGLKGVLDQRVLHDEIPILGICLGMQMFANSSQEGSVKGLGWIDAEIKKFDFSVIEAKNHKIPHMGWNYVNPTGNHTLFKGVQEPIKCYFVHSFHYQCKKQENVLARASYGYEFTCAVVKNNIIGVQFHPEKSHKFGMQILSNFSKG